MAKILAKLRLKPTSGRIFARSPPLEPRYAGASEAVPPPTRNQARRAPRQVHHRPRRLAKSRPEGDPDGAQATSRTAMREPKWGLDFGSQVGRTMPANFRVIAFV
jgi:hypothetical protein